MNNIIINDREEIIGYYKDLRAYLVDLGNQYLGNPVKTEEAAGIVDVITDLDGLSEYDGLIVVSENNGMGTTVSKYEGER